MIPTRRRVAHVQGPSWDHPWLEDLVVRLPAQGWEPLVVSIDPEGPLQARLRARGIRSHALESPGRVAYLRAAVRLAGLLRDVDVVHAHLLDAEIVCEIAATLVPRPVVITQHAGPGLLDLAPTRGLKRAVRRAVDAAILRRATALIAPSDLTRADLIRRGADPARVHKILLGVDVERLRACDAAGAGARRQELSPGSSYVVVVAGRLAPEKRVEVLLRAWRSVVAARPDSRLLVLGDGPERGALESLTHSIGINPSVSFLGWRKDVPDVMLAADAVATASAVESTGLVLLEALALAKPLVTTPVGIANEYLIHGVHCLVVRHGDVAALADALLRIAADRRSAAAMGVTGRQVVESRSAIEPMVQAYCALYDALIDAPVDRIRPSPDYPHFR